MNQEFSYKDYVQDDSFMDSYSAYQMKYAKSIRESDRKLIEIIRRFLPAATHRQGGPISLLDVGCSTGNLLLHLKNHFDRMELHGADMVPAILEACRQNEALAGIQFHYGNILELDLDGRFDFIIVNAVLYLLSDSEYSIALKRMYQNLRSGGRLLCFDFCHDFPQDLAILEKSASHPEGLMLHFRPARQVGALLAEAGFIDPQFEPFRIPIELPRNDDPNLITYTVKAASGENMLFRGTLYQPWCHFHAQRP